MTSGQRRGQPVKCARCDGAGFLLVWSFGVKEPDECVDCGGSGQNWQYPGGAIARYYSGPLIGRVILKEQNDG